MSEKKYTSGQAAKVLGISKDTLRRLEIARKLKPIRLKKNNYRCYSESELENYSENLNPARVVKKWIEDQEGYEPLSSSYCSFSSLFLLRLSRLEQVLAQVNNLTGDSSLITAIAGEIGNNSFDHNLVNWPDIPGIFFAFDIKRRNIVLADRGRGVLATLRTIKPTLKDDKEALHTAFTEIISGRSPESRGNGLKFVRDVVANSKLISLFFKSGNAELSIGKFKKDLKISESKRAFRGCLAVIKF